MTGEQWFVVIVGGVLLGIVLALALNKGARIITNTDDLE